MKAFLLLLSGLLRLVQSQQGNVCLMVYQMADNDLEKFMRDDNHELISSPAIRDSTMTTWVYFDGRNYLGSWWHDIDEPLKDVYDSSGNALQEKETGSRYLKWDHALGKMVVNQTLEGEQNGDSPQVVFEFLVTALTDCVSRGSLEYFLVFSSHGGGFYGFGGDDHISRSIRRRRLVQPNDWIVMAIREALDSVPNVPSLLDVLGFDACLMQSVGALDDYRSVTRYYMASQAVEPGHGWAYEDLSDTSSALNLATEILNEFIDQRQGWWHQVPKTLAIVESSKFETFLAAWDDLSQEFESLLDDADFFVQLARARSAALSFQYGVLDGGELEKPSALDIGDLMKQIQTLCVPESNSQLQAKLASTQSLYDDMFVLRRVGRGSPEAATGMHITWPVRRAYHSSNQTLMDAILFDTERVYATADAPYFLSFLKSWYNAKTPPPSDTSVCTQRTTSNLQTDDDTRLLLNPTLEDLGSTAVVESDIAQVVDEVLVEYGVDLTPWLLEDRRGLRESFDGRHLVQADSDSRPGRRARPRRRTAETHRRAEDDEEYFIFFGGDVMGEYKGATYSATWDKKFYVLTDSTGDNFEPIYALDVGSGTTSTPVVYFSEEFPIDSIDLPLGTTEVEALDAGGQYGYLSFSSQSDEEGGQTVGTIQNLILFTYDIATDTIQETPRSKGGSIVPILYAEGLIGGFEIEELVGGFGETVVAWKESDTLEVLVVDADSALEALNLTTLVVDVVAYNDDPLNEESEFVSFAIGPDGVAMYGGDFDEDRPQTGGYTPTSSTMALLPGVALVVWNTISAILSCSLCLSSSS